MGTDIFIENSDESAIEEPADILGTPQQELDKDAAIHIQALDEEPEEVLPLEFLENPELCSSVLPPDAIDSSRFQRETTIMSPEQVRRNAAAGTAKPKLSSRRTAAAGGSSRRSQKVNVEDLSPEELAKMRKNDRKAKLVIYAGLLILTLGFVALFTYKLPGLLPDQFPNGVWPWNVILDEYKSPY